MNKKLIDADLFTIGIALYMAENAYLNDTALDVLKMVATWLEEAPTVDAVEVVHGRWSDWENDPMWKQCTACKFIIQYSYSKDCKFCPNCGAKMEA